MSTTGAEILPALRSMSRCWLMAGTIRRPYSVVSFYLQDESQPFTKLSIVAGIRRDKFSYSA